MTALFNRNCSDVEEMASRDWYLSDCSNDRLSQTRILGDERYVYHNTIGWRMCGDVC